eukprot:TRINITY_DN3057_c0_g1_i10.p1 TRINITY_DN3057_c0_g1~~TRINITY_DN3057_c0_g1_i10.p1  ORF type:complete len:127 (+),score=11.39 TRINITY_DN3057_c0_g1_i10:857-1237(+)
MSREIVFMLCSTDLFGAFEHFIQPLTGIVLHRMHRAIPGGPSYERLLALDRRNVQRGVSAEAMSKLKTTTGTPKDTQTQCQICFDNFSVGTKVTTLPCEHSYHYDCIKKWFESHRTCPICRFEVEK